MFDIYKARVLAHYQEKLGEGKLSNNLSTPTEGKLKAECALVYRERYSPQYDRQALRDFFGDPDPDGSFTTAIKKFDRERFKGLNSYLADTKKSPNNTNIELLAFLIDYRPRPYRFDEFQPEDDGENVGQEEESKPGTITEPTSEDGDIPVPPITPPTVVGKTWVEKYGKKTALLALIIIGAAFTLKYLKQGKECMYWNGDHYEEIECDRQVFQREVVALDTFKLSHFRKITQPDTLTTASLGKTWCVNIDGKYYCFTADGKYPLSPYKELKPLSLTILRNHFGGKR